MSKQVIHCVGFGSQGAAWAQCLRQSGWDVRVYLAKTGESYKKAEALGFHPMLNSELSKALSANGNIGVDGNISAGGVHWVAMLCPDTAIAPIYNEYISNSPAPVRLILAHGYAVYSKELVFKHPQHQATLLAPKAIGPKLLQNFKTAFPAAHSLVAAVTRDDGLREIARGLGFEASRLVLATFEQEAIGDLISEQGLLCGGVFNLLAWTFEAMTKAGIPDALIREECLTELELVAGLIRERGPSATFQAISHAAQCGTIAMGERFEAAKLKEHWMAQANSVVDGSFVEYFRSSPWRAKAQTLVGQFKEFESRFKHEGNIESGSERSAGSSHDNNQESSPVRSGEKNNERGSEV